MAFHNFQPKSLEGSNEDFVSFFLDLSYKFYQDYS
jgi:hypothetical protein